MKKKLKQNYNGISISDSIVMSVKRKNSNPRKPFSVAIALIGFISFIMAFLGMYKLPFDTEKVLFGSIFILAFYITVSVIGGRALWLYPASLVLFLFAAFKKASKLVLGYKFAYNFIYKVTFESKIDYYRNLQPSLRTPSITTIVLFFIWLLAMVLCFFTICRPNPVLPLLMTFPFLEIGLYNGVILPVFWGILCIAYWMSLLSMSSIDAGEYSGGQSGFVRKNELFFPKRHMKLKVTERCGMMVICSVVITAVLSMSLLKITHYKRSDKINQKRRDITNAVDEFSFEDLADSLARLSASFGLDLEYDNRKLGNNSHIRYKNITDLTITLDTPASGAIYLKEYTRSDYKGDMWDDMPPSDYENELFSEFKKYNIHPQDFPAAAIKILNNDPEKNKLRIVPASQKRNHTYVPYCTLNTGNIGYIDDTLITPKNQKKGDNTYDLYTNSIINSISDSASADSYPALIPVDINALVDIPSKENLNAYCSDHELLSYDKYIMVECADFLNHSYISSSENPNLYLTLLLQNEYKNFVHEKYLKVPDTPEMDEIRDKFANIVNNRDISSTHKTLAVLEDIRDSIHEISTYTLSPGKTPSTRDFVNYFLLENHKGYCPHYASAGVILARMAGIPARYATGYVVVGSDIESGKTNSDGSVTINVKDSRSHAWAEVYIDGAGWIPYEFTDGYSESEINTAAASAPKETTATETTTTLTTTTTTTSATSSISRSSTTHTNGSALSTTTTKKHIASGILRVDSGGKLHLPKWIKITFKLIALLALLVCILILRRRIILYFRNKHFTTGKTSDRILKMYGYAEKMLDLLDMQSENGNYVSFASQVEKGYGGVYFTKNEFENFTQIALKTRYGNVTPTQEEVDMCYKTVSDFSDNMFKRSERMKKLIIKYIYVL